MFFLYGLKQISYKKPTSEYLGKHYSPAIHEAAFVLPAWQRKWLG